METVTNTETIAARAVDVVKAYGTGETAVRALDGVSVDFYNGQFTAVMGPSGSGKSTLMHCMAALDKPTSGGVFLGNTDVTSLNDRDLTKLRRDRVGFVFQAFNLLPQLNARENMILPMRLAGNVPETEWMNKIVHTVGLADRLDHHPSQLSGGQQQRVAVARALMSRPDIIFADEPTGNLDSQSGQEVLNFLRQSVDEYHQTIVMVTHDPVAASYSDRVVFLADGRLQRELINPTADAVLETMKEMG